MTTLTKIDEYEAMYPSNNLSSLWGPRIWLKCEGKYMGEILFKANGSVLPSDKSTSGQINLFCRLDNSGNIIDLLRNEKPMYLLFTGSAGMENSNLGSNKEIVHSDQESISLFELFNMKSYFVNHGGCVQCSA